MRVFCCRLPGGLQHVLPILIAVVVSFVVGQCYSVSIFESILENKGLLTMPEFKNPATWMKTAKDVMLVRSACYTNDIVKVVPPKVPTFSQCQHPLNPVLYSILAAHGLARSTTWVPHLDAAMREFKTGEA